MYDRMVGVGLDERTQIMLFMRVTNIMVELITYIQWVSNGLKIHPFPK
jgi:hypothetical protein